MYRSNAGVSRIVARYRLGNAAFIAAEADYATTRGYLLVVIVLNIALAFTFAWRFSAQLLRQLGGEPEYAAGIARRVASGELNIEVTRKPRDSSSLLYALHAMVANLQPVMIEISAAAYALTDASSQVSGTAQSLQQTATEQAASLEETSATIDSFSGAIANNHGSALYTDKVAR